MNTQDWFPLGWTGWISLLSKNLLQHHSSKASILCCSAFFTVRLSHPYMTIGKTIALGRQTFVGKAKSLLFNMLSRLVITFLPRSKCLLISWLQSPSAVILEPPQNKVCYYFHCFPIYLSWSDGPRCHDLSFLNAALFFFFNFTFFFFKLYIIVLALPNIKMNSSQVYMCPPS